MSHSDRQRSSRRSSRQSSRSRSSESRRSNIDRSQRTWELLDYNGVPIYSRITPMYFDGFEEFRKEKFEEAFIEQEPLSCRSSPWFPGKTCDMLSSCRSSHRHLPLASPVHQRRMDYGFDHDATLYQDVNQQPTITKRGRRSSSVSSSDKSSGRRRKRSRSKTSRSLESDKPPHRADWHVTPVIDEGGRSHRDTTQRHCSGSSSRRRSRGGSLSRSRSRSHSTRPNHAGYRISADQATIDDIPVVEKQGSLELTADFSKMPRKQSKDAWRVDDSASRNDELLRLRETIEFCRICPIDDESRCYLGTCRLERKHIEQMVTIGGTRTTSKGFRGGNLADDSFRLTLRRKGREKMEVDLHCAGVVHQHLDTLKLGTMVIEVTYNSKYSKDRFIMHRGHIIKILSNTDVLVSQSERESSRSRLDCPKNYTFTAQLFCAVH